MMPKSKGNAYFIACQKGAEEAAKELGVDADLGRPDRSRPGQAKRDRRDLDHPRRGCDRRGRREPRGASPRCCARPAHGASRSSPGTPTPSPMPATSSSTRPRREGIGYTLMDDAARVLGRQGRVRHHHRVAHRGEHERVAKAHRERRAEKYPDIKLAALRPCDDMQKKAFDEANTILNAYPNVKLIMAICSPAVPGAAEAVKQSGRNDVKVIGLGLPNENKRVRPRRHHRRRRPVEHHRPGLPDRAGGRCAGTKGTLKPGDKEIARRASRHDPDRRATTSCSASRSRSRRTISISLIFDV